MDRRFISGQTVIEATIWIFLFGITARALIPRVHKQFQKHFETSRITKEVR